MGLANYVDVVKIFDSETITAGNSVESDAIRMNQYKPDGYFSLQIEVSGSGTVTVDYLLSNDGDTFKRPTGASSIFSSFGASSGPDGDGKDIQKINPEMPFAYLKIKVTAATADMTVTAWLAIQ